MIYKQELIHYTLHFRLSPFTFLSLLEPSVVNLLINVREKWIKMKSEEKSWKKVRERRKKMNKRLHYASSDEPAEQFFIFHAFDFYLPRLRLLSFNSREMLMYTKYRFNFFDCFSFFGHKSCFDFSCFTTRRTTMPPSCNKSSNDLYIQIFLELQNFRVLWSIYVRIVSNKCEPSWSRISFLHCTRGAIK